MSGSVPKLLALYDDHIEELIRDQYFAERSLKTLIALKQLLDFLCNKRIG